MALSASLLLLQGSALLPAPPLTLAPPGSWPAPRGDGLHLGDVRAVLVVNRSSGGNDSVAAQIFWRRRDAHPYLKAVVVTDSSHRWMPSSATVSAGCGRVTFSPLSGRGVYYAYYLPHYQTGGGAALHFRWYDCKDHSRECVLEGRAAATAERACATVVPAEAAVCARLEGRTSSASADRVGFPSFTEMELQALPAELDAMVAAAGRGAAPLAFLTERSAAVRMFGEGQVPLRWARSGPVHELRATALAGEYYSFQVGLYAASGAASAIALDFSPLVPRGRGSPVAAAAFTCFNLGGVDHHGQRFTKDYALLPRHVGSLWVGLALPDSALAVGSYTANITLRASVGGVETATQLTLALEVALPRGGQPLAAGGASDIYTLRRLAWLDSSRGIDETVTSDFAPVRVARTAAGGLTLRLVNKELSIAPTGLLEQAVVHTAKVRRGRSTSRSTSVLHEAVAFEVVLAGGDVLPLAPSQPLTLVSASTAACTWEVTLRSKSTKGAGVVVSVRGTAEFDSYVEYNVTVALDGAAPPSARLRIEDVRLRVDAAGEYLLGFGAEGRALGKEDLAWRWRLDPTAQCCGDNMVWVGGVDAGTFVKLKGSGDSWNNPMYSQDYPVIPFIPPSWGGADAPSGAGESATGANVTTDATRRSARVVAFSGPRTLAPGGSVSFLFDVAVTPSKKFNHTRHFSGRYFQVGYNTAYLSPQQVAATNATVVTLHQGVPGLVNGSLVNPNINYPFVPQTVALLENYTSQAHALGLAVKFYYTIRELSNHAAELFALLSLQGEVLLDRDPYVEPQAGYCHDYDCHGGDVWLHEHVQANYSYCWQQQLSDGEWDAAICDTGTSRWFNYYVEGLHTSVSQAPHIDGIYYDGINFDRRSMRRVRKTLDAAAREAGSQRRPLVDIHTGEVRSSPSSLSYVSHFAYADRAWNGEGFDFSQPPAYWLVDISGLQHGV